jgi:hypothetical protein
LIASNVPNDLRDCQVLDDCDIQEDHVSVLTTMSLMTVLPWMFFMS